MRRRIGITGLGIVAPHGDDPHVVFRSLCAGQSAIHAWQHADDAPAVVASVAFDPSKWFTRLQLAGVDRVSQFAVAAAESARQDARWNENFAPDRIGVYVGTGIGGAASVEEAYRRTFQSLRVPPLTVVAGMPNAPAAHVAMRAGVTGPVLSYSIACASSAIAIAEAGKAIACGDIDVAIAGGCEALLVPGVIRAWQAMQTLATPDRVDPATSCRPFSAERTGLVLGEGAAFMVLEALDEARARGANVYAELAGSGMSCDASHLTKPNSAGQIAALKMALAKSGLDPAEIGYCNAHGTATRVGDVVECASLQNVWGEALNKLRVSSTKSMHGHLLGAAGALEALVTVLAVHQQILPPNAHCAEQDPACDISLIRGQAEAVPALIAAISNSFAFGGTNSVLVFRRAH